MINKMCLTADFETIARDGEECVWLWDVCNIITLSHESGISIHSFVEYIDNIKFPCNVYFHNLKFDGSFLIDYMLKNGISMVDKKGNKLCKGEFSPLITEFGQFIKIEYKNKSGKNISFIDSLKILPMSIKKLAKDFKLSLKKGEIDYAKPRPEGYVPTGEEMAYIYNDTEIAALCLRKMLDEGHTKITLSSCAFDEYKKLLGQRYKTWFGEWETSCDLERDKFIRNAFRGGLCQFNKNLVNTTIKQPVYYNDVNSLYPYVMYNLPLPYGTPLYYEGKYDDDPDYPYYVQRIRIDMAVREGCIPCILYKAGNTAGNMYIHDTLEQSECGGAYELTVTNFDLELIYKNYEIYYIEFLDGYKFKVRNDMFTDYVDKYTKMKEQATIDGNSALRTIAKLLLNSLFGKFGQNPRRRKKLPYIDENGKIKMDKSELEIVNSFKYLPVAVFITSHARYKIINDILTIGYDNWVYTDTDSILSLVPMPTQMLDNVKLGKYKVEHLFKKARVLGAKTYYGITSEGNKVVKMCGCNKVALKEYPIGKFNYFDKSHPEVGGIVRGGRTTLKTCVGGKRLDFGDFCIKDKRIIHVNRQMTIEEIKSILDKHLKRDNKVKLLRKTVTNHLHRLLQILTGRN